MGSTISISAPIAAGVEPAQRAEPAGTGQASDLQRAYREQCGKVLDGRRDERDDGREGDDTEAARAHAGKKTKRRSEPLAAALWMPALPQARDRTIALRCSDARLGSARRDAGGEAGFESGSAEGAATRGDAAALDAVLATGERAPGASMADARAPHAAAETAPPPASAHAGHADRRTLDAAARAMAAAASRPFATPAEQPAGVAQPSATSPARSPSSSPTTAIDVASAAAAAKRLTAGAAHGAAREGGDGDDQGRSGDAAIAGFPRAFQPSALTHAAKPTSRAHDPSRTAGQRAQAGAAHSEARDIRDTQGTRVRYSFNSWDGQPAVELRFDSVGAPRVVNAQPSHERVQRAMEHGVDRLTPGWSVQFDRQRPDDDGGRLPWRRARQQPEADEQ
ncbi:BsaU protein [Burkholderia sp. BKH01]|uniref:SpaN/EivJ family type III secretion system needle length determinant n=1 Tax=Burkholderia sp. BKH01 TaxID=2769262 RepID=UPI0021E04976|nr:BsaU protein [Burkholderia sp. BKH01]MCU9952209.1 BsaU protein [Burkholderia sp. BKH01]